jgi:hypothetical protein
LANFVGLGGARALFDRSLKLSRPAFPWLGDAVAPKGESPWPRLLACFEANESSALAASTALIATLLNLFATFVGTGLALRILRQHRPDVFAPDASKETA